MTQEVEKILHVKVQLSGEIIDDFLLIKKYFGLENNTDVMRATIRSVARTIRNQKGQLSEESQKNYQESE